MELTPEATAKILDNALKHGKFNVQLTNAVENAVRLLTPVPAEMEGGGQFWFKVCGECHGQLRQYDKFCPECGRGVLTEGGK